MDGFSKQHFSPEFNWLNWFFLSDSIFQVEMLTTMGVIVFSHWFSMNATTNIVFKHLVICLLQAVNIWSFGMDFFVFKNFAQIGPNRGNNGASLPIVPQVSQLAKLIILASVTTPRFASILMVLPVIARCRDIWGEGVVSVSWGSRQGGEALVRPAKPADTFRSSQIAPG